MKNTTLILSFLLPLAQLFSAETPLRPIGTFVYEGEVLVSNKRSAVTVSHITAEGQAKIKNYKSMNFICIRRSQKESICQKNEALKVVPDFARDAVDKFLQGRHFDFSGVGEPELIYDGATTEWLVREPVSLGGKKIDLYKIVKTHEGKWNLSFPVSVEQPLTNMDLFSANHLALPLVLQAKEGELTVGYFLSAQLKTHAPE